jgi:hypothetical protein
MRCVLALLLFSACSQRTEIVVGVATDLKAKGQIDRVTFDASRGGVPIIQHEWPLADLPAGHYELPGSFGLYSPDGSETRIELSVKGYRDTALVTQRDSIVSLVSGKTLFMRMAIVGDCGNLSQPTCGPSQTCVEGVCRDIEVNGKRLPDYKKELVTSVVCDSGSQFIVSSTGNLMPMIGPGCSSDEYCQEGTCYKLLANEDGALQQGLWTEQSSSTTFVLRALWGTSDGADVFAAGDHGVILHLSANGPMAASAWVPEDSGTTENLYAIYGTSVSDVWAAGNNGTFVHRDATKWTPLTPTTPARIDDLQAFTSTDAWAVGRADASTPVVLHFTGASWNTVTLPSVNDLRALWGNNSNDLWFVGENANILHWTGGSFTPLQAPAKDNYLGVGGAGSDVWFVGRQGRILHGMNLDVEASPVSTDLFHVWANPSGSDVFIVGDHGVILHRENGMWVQQTSHTVQPLFAVWGSTKGDLFAAGRDGVLLHNTGVITECATDTDCTPICQAGMLTTRSCQLGVCVSGTAVNCDGGLACFDTTSCRTSCSTDVHCRDTHYCATDGTCQPSEGRGSYCDDIGFCKEPGCRVCHTGLFCTDNVCCDQSPTQCGGCMHCEAPSGSCVPVPYGQDHKTFCETQAKAPCVMPVCNGEGNCGDQGAACGHACSGQSVQMSVCQDGVCTSPAPSPCPSPFCGNGSVPNQCPVNVDQTSCTTDTNCQNTVTTHYCDGNNWCHLFKQKGESCDPTSSTHCASPPCKECATGLTCVDGVCCDSPCGGQCQACDLPGKVGTCTMLTSGQPHPNPRGPSPRPACNPATGACAAECTGTSATACSASGAVCATPRCDAANNYTLLAAAICAAGSCGTQASSSCAPYACAFGACRTKCAADTDCASTSAGCDLKSGTCK